jgi:hypothetical protein
MSVPDGTTAAGYLVPEPPLATQPPFKTGGDKVADGGEADQVTPPSTNPGGTDDDNGGGGNGGGDNDGGGNGGGDDGGNGPLPQVSVPPLPSTQVDPIDDVLTLAQAIVQCTLDGISQLNLKQWNACIKDYTS